MRLAKYLAHAGVASRRAAEEIVFAGRVTVAGEVVRDPARGVEPGDDVRVDGEPVEVVAEPVVYAVHKPPGVISTASDPQGRPTVVDLVPSDRRLYPVGRLDYTSSGLILLTDDGALAHRLTHPSFEVAKTYRATVSHPPVKTRTLQQLARGVELEDGITAPAQVRKIAPNIIEITIHEGRNRQVRRMCEAVGHPVTALQRIAFGGLELGRLKPGGHRRLTADEVRRLGLPESAPSSWPKPASSPSGAPSRSARTTRRRSSPRPRS